MTIKKSNLNDLFWEKSFFKKLKLFLSIKEIEYQLLFLSGRYGLKFFAHYFVVIAEIECMTQ